MARRTFSGSEVLKVLVNVGGFEWRRTTGDHAQLYYEHPTNNDDRRQVTVPLHRPKRLKNRDRRNLPVAIESVRESWRRRPAADCSWRRRRHAVHAGRESRKLW